MSFKLKDLKASVPQKDQTREATEVTTLPNGSRHQEPGNAMHNEQVEQFKQLYSVILDPLEEALAKVSMVWRNVEEMNVDKIQKEVVQTALRLQLQQTLSFIYLNSKANAVEFKQPMPDFGHITGSANKTE